MNYQRKLFWLIAIATLIRLIIAHSVELSNVEVYYWALSTKLQWNYFDHPPMVAWLIRLTTFNVTHCEVLVRLGAIISAGVCTWLMFKLGTMIRGQRAGWFAALLYTTSLYSSMAIGLFIIPDSPQMVFWLGGMWVLLKLIHTPANNSRYALLWCLFGLLAGLCIMSKVHGVFLWVGMAAYLLLYDRNRFKSPYVYLALVITAIIVSPIIIWNVQHNFITYRFHSSRVNVVHTGINLRLFLKSLVGVIFSTGPIHYFLIGSGIYWSLKNNTTLDKKISRALLLCGLPLIVILLFISLFKETLPHWPGPAFCLLLLLPAIRLASAQTNTAGKLPLVLKWAVGYALVIGVLQVVVINYFPGTLSTEKQGMKIGTGDVTLDMYGWKQAALKYDSLYSSDVKNNLMPLGAPIIITNWIPAAHIDFYMASVTGQQTYGLGDVFDLHQYYWMNNYKRPLKQGDDAYYICPSNVFTYKTFNKVVNSFKSYDMALILPIYRSTLVCKTYYIFRLKGYKQRRQNALR